MEHTELKAESLEKASLMLRAIAHPVRIAIVSCLQDDKAMTVTEIYNVIGIEQSVASHHLGILKDKGVLGSKREGKNTRYFLRHPSLKTVLNCIGNCCQ